MLLAALALLGIAISAAPKTAHAQQAEGVLGWLWANVYYPTADEACRAQWHWANMDNSNITHAYLGTYPAGDGNINARSCDWVYLGHYCSSNCGTVYPNGVEFRCNAGYVTSGPGQCIKSGYTIQQRCAECQTQNNGGVTIPKVGDPIDLVTGTVFRRNIDFSSDDGRFVISRTYQNKGLIGETFAGEFARSLGGNWGLDFAKELHITRLVGTAAAPSDTNVALVGAGGIAFEFQLQANGTWIPRSPGGNYYASTNLKLEFIGTLPSQLNTIWNSSTQWRVTDGEDTVWIYQTFPYVNTGRYAAGKPLSRTWRDGYRWDYSYNSDGSLATVTDSFGRSATFSWRKFYSGLNPVTSGLLPTPEAITSIVLPDQTQLRYTYDPPESGGPTTPSTAEVVRLTKVERLDAASTVIDSTSYLYEDVRYPSAITGVIDNRGTRVSSYTYHAYAGYPNTESGANGADLTTTTWAGWGWGGTYTATATNALGKVQTYTFPGFNAAQGGGYRLTAVNSAATANTPSSQRTITWTGGPFITAQTDDLARQTTYVRDTRGRPTTINEVPGTADARSTTIAYDASLNLPATITRPGVTETRSYASGSLASLTLTDTTTITVPYATNGRTRTTAYSWSPQGNLLSLDGPLPGSADSVTLTYDSAGQLATRVNQVGQTVTVISRNTLGRPLTVRDENGVDTTFTYDAMGRPLTVTRNPGASQSQYAMQYDATGNLTRLTLPMGGWLAYTYDGNNRVTRIDNDSGEAMTFTLNALGKPTAEQVLASGGAIARTSTKAYDELGRMIRAVGAGGETWQYAWDKVGNLTSTTDARGKVWSSAVDNLDRVKTETNPLSQAENKVWSQADGLTQFRDGRNLATNNIIDGFGNVIRESSPDRGTTDYQYDEADRLTSVVDGDGITTNYTWDAADRLLSETSSGAGFAAQTVTYSYDATAGGNKGVGRLTGVTDPSGSTAYTYDEQGRVSTRDMVVKGLGSTPPPDRTYSFQYTYDANGAVTSITYPSGHIVDYARAADGRLTAVQTRTTAASSPADLATGLAYKPFGPLAGLTFGNGLALTRSYDQNYWLTGIALVGSASLLDLTIARDANGNLASVTDNLATTRNAAYTYTNADRLATASGVWGSDSYTWDAAGNRTRADRTVGGSTASDVATIASASNRQTEVRTGAGALAKSFTFRNGGDTASQTVTPTTSYTYDARGRIASISEGGAITANYAYDFQQHRVASLDSAGAQVHYLFDDSGRLLAEYDALSNNLLREYVWADDMPVAMATGAVGSPAWSYITTGHLSEPVLVTDQAGAITSSTTRDPWGNNILIAGSQVIAMGYPGQWKDLAGGLFHNWNRDYDPALGRYIESDPIGLEGGANLYAYVGGNPVNRADPEGLRQLNLFSPFASRLRFWKDYYMWRAANHSPDTDGVCLVYAHGTANNIWVFGTQTNAQDFAKVLRVLGCRDDEPVVLYACNTGSDPLGFAKQLADARYTLSRRRLPIYAPNSLVYYDIRSGAPGARGLIGPMIPSADGKSRKAGSFSPFFPSER